MTPLRFGRYFLLKKLAVGGMGEVWLARVAGDSDEQPPIVVKRLLAHLKEDQEFVNMFFDEARIAAALNHQNIARIEDLGEVGGDYYIAMEFVHGMSFGDVVNAALEAGTDMPVALKCRVIAEAAAALDFAHHAKTEAGAPLELIHRDVSPQNIMVGFDGSVKLIDFGVARAANKLTRTATGIIKGKYAYMSPEQAWGKDLDGRSDLFGLGIVLWEVLALERLFKRENDTATLRAVVGAEIEPPSKKELTVPKALDAIVLKALARDLGTRFQTGTEFKKALEAFLTKQRLPATKAHLAGWMQKLFPEEARAQLPAHPEPSSPGERSSPVLKPAIENPKLPRSRVLDTSELEQRIASAGSGAIRGMFCNALLAAVMKLAGPVADQKVRKAAAEPKPYVDQLSYPTTEFLRMLWKAVELVLPKARNVDEAFELLGAAMMDGLVRSPFGKALEGQKERFPDAILKPLLATLNPMIAPGQRLVSSVAPGRAVLVFKDEVLPIQLYIGLLRSLVQAFYRLPIEARWEKPSAQRIELSHRVVSDGYIHGGTDAREVARLEKQADFVSGFTFPLFDAAPGQRVLDLACGVGAMAVRLERAFPGIELVGVDLSKQQLAACRANHAELAVARANGESLPFADATFDRVHCSWMLEHVPRPQAIVTEVCRVLKPGGSCQFVEVDNWSLSTRPHLPEVHELLALLNAAQVRAGGDPAIGPKLAPLFTAAGFSRFTLQPVQLVATPADPRFLAGFIDEFAEIFESLDESLGAQTAGLIVTATSQLRALLHVPDVELRYTPWVARGIR